ncbi:MAG: T9SS type A sorting domain-containing protein, partial [Bacteroidetes bacterium]
VSVSQQGFGLKGVFQTRFNGLPSNERVFNVPNSGGNYMFIARDESQLDFVSGSSAVDKDIEFRFEGDSSWALLRRTSVASSAWVRVPFSVWQMDRDDTSPIGRRIYPVITRQGQDSVWRTRVLLDRGYNGKPLKEFYPISVVADSYCVPTIGRCFGTYIVADTLHPDYPFIKALLYTRTESNERSLGLYEVYIADLDEDGAPAPRGTFVRFKRYKDIFDGDEKLILPSAITYNDAHAMRVEIEKVNVFPNPYYGVNRAETNNSERFVTFNHLPYQAIIRIFNLAGVMVKTIQKNDETQFTAWNLNNENNLPVASGLYIAQIEMRDSQGSPLGTKELKLMIVQGERFR